MSCRTLGSCVPEVMGALGFTQTAADSHRQKFSPRAHGSQGQDASHAHPLWMQGQKLIAVWTKEAS